MAVLEIETFSLEPRIDTHTFRSLDEQMQEWCYLNRPGLARRTTATNADGSYVVITLFGEAADATTDYQNSSDDIVRQWMSAISTNNRRISVYTLL